LQDVLKKNSLEYLRMETGIKLKVFKCLAWFEQIFPLLDGADASGFFHLENN
jgi:hypothetical protein